MKYKVRIYAYAATGAAASYGVGTLVATLENAKNIGYADYANDIPEAFFTLAQEDADALLVRTYENKAHVRIYRDDELVWGGWLGEADANTNDVIYYCYGYLSSLYSLHTGYPQQWEDVHPIKTETSPAKDGVAQELYNQVKAYSYSPLRWTTVGTLSNPFTDDTLTTKLTIPKYAAYYKRALFVMRELAALGASDTAQVCRFWITPAGQFNFTSAPATHRPEAVLRWGDDRVQNFSERRMPIEFRNQLAFVGSRPNSTESTIATNGVQPIIAPGTGGLPTPAASGYVDNQLYQVEGGNLFRKTGGFGSGTWTDLGISDADLAEYGLRQESVYYSYIPSMSDMMRISALRLKRAKRYDVSVQVSLHTNSFPSPASSAGLCGIGDTIPVDIRFGSTNINANLIVAGYKVIWSRETENVRLLLQEAP